MIEVRIDVRCPRCDAPACLPCRNVKTGAILYGYHAKRLALAARRSLERR